MFEKDIKKVTKAQQKKAIKKVIHLMNKYRLTITTEHLIKIVPFDTGEGTHEEDKEG